MLRQPPPAAWQNAATNVDTRADMPADPHGVADALADHSTRARAYGAAQIVIVDDDPGLRDLLAGYLFDNGLGVEAVSNGAALRARLRRQPCDLVILDMMMPGEDGLSVLRALTQTDDLPAVIMLSALSGEVDRVVALEIGADDYVTKPSTPREILARIRSVLRRRNRAMIDEGEEGEGGGGGGGFGGGGADGIGATATGGMANGRATYRFAGWTLHCRMRSLQAPGGEIVSLTDGEFQMLDAFVTRPDIIHTREDMIALSGRIDALAKDRTIDVNISRLLRKLAAFDGTEIIRTVRGKGYVFISDVTGA